MKISPPQKPFPDYKWRWAVLTPTESLNEPPVFLGVLRVFNEFNNYSPGDSAILEGLHRVQTETNSGVDLVRNSDRNLVRNSGQYWKALGLLGEAHGKISVSPFGQLLADGKITQVEFATTVVKTLELPNKRIESQETITEWRNAGLNIKPLELILDIITFIGENISLENAYITPLELRRIVIPLAGVKADIETHSHAVMQYRNGILDLTAWPDCTPKSNDKRMSREFLLFLSNYGFCKRTYLGYTNDNERYFVSSISKDEIDALHKMQILDNNLENVVKQIRITQIPSNVERKKVSRSIIERPYQSIFRRNILTVFCSTCVVTGVSIENVLEAAHIKPVEYNGDDSYVNGLCLRSDIHQLFDSNNLRILSTGELVFSEAAAARNNYGSLPKKIEIPEFVSREFLDWRIKYY